MSDDSESEEEMEEQSQKRKRRMAVVSDDSESEKEEEGKVSHFLSNGLTRVYPGSYLRSLRFLTHQYLTKVGFI